MKTGTRIYFDPDTLAWLKAEAGKRRCSVSHLVRSLAYRAMEEKAGFLKERAAFVKANGMEDWETT